MPVANAFAEKATKFLPILDEVYKKEAVTSILEAPGVQFSGTRKIKVPKITLDGAGDYDRTNGYTSGAVNVEYGEYELEQDRGRRFRIDVLDDDEAAFDLYRRVVTEYVRVKEIPEVDAYRFSKIAALAGKVVPEAIAAGGALTAFDAARKYLIDTEVNLSNLAMFVSSDYELALRQDPSIQRRYDVNVNNANINRNVNMLDGIVPVIVVPAPRFYDVIQLNDGKTSGQEAGGYKTVAGTSKALNFVLAPISTMQAITKRTNTKIITPEVNQNADAYDVLYRLFHDLIVLDNKKASIYVSKGV